MSTIPEISQRLRTRLHEQGLTQAELREAAGVAQRTLTNVLSGDQDFKLSTLLALADRLGLQVVLVPKGASGAFDKGEPEPPRVPTRVDMARRQLRGASE